MAIGIFFVKKESSLMTRVNSRPINISPMRLISIVNFALSKPWFV